MLLNIERRGDDMSIWKRAALLVGAGLVLSGGGWTAFAQQNNEGASGLSISPTRTELNVAPGASQEFSISLRNVSGTDIIANAIINDFESDDQTGEPRLLSDTGDPSPASIRNFLSGLSDIALKKDEKKDIKLNVQVPADAAPGGYYGVVRFTAVPTNQQAAPGQVALTASVGTLVLIEVPGDITEQIQILNLQALHDNNGGNFFLKPPNRAAITIKNNGNSFSKPLGRVALTNMRSQEVYSYELNNTDPRGNILPNSVRTFTDKLQNIKTPGRYSLMANISHGSGSEVLTYKVSFWYLPPWVLAVIAIVLLGIIGAAFILYRRRFSSKPKRRR
jgi:hypothetical protein